MRWEGGSADSLRIDIENLEIAAQGNRGVQLLLGGQTNIATLMLELMAEIDDVSINTRLEWRYYPRKPRVQDRIVGGRQQQIRAKQLRLAETLAKTFCLADLLGCIRR